MTTVVPHIARGRRLVLGLFITAVVITTVVVAAVAAFGLIRLAG
ncbi:hypothetical protein [Streptomyces sp. NBC_01803]|nr:hypothetical protein [Streptomyces sp. NBC_01803]WSA43216.1 hypothetical protein OIE51_02815 [Streptomyces sp. NBC_01803]